MTIIIAINDSMQYIQKILKSSIGMKDSIETIKAAITVSYKLD